MSRPGDRLRALASWIFDADTMERLIDPVVADLQVEYAEASRTGRVWRRRWVRTVGYASLLYVATRPLRVFLALTFALTVLLALPPILKADVKIVGTSAVYLIPEGLVLAVPMALTLAIAWAGRSTRQSPRATIIAGVVCSIFMFVTLAWIMPSANQAFRVSLTREFNQFAPPPPGPSEMSIGQVREQMKSTRTVNAETRDLQLGYYWRWALSCASLPLTLLMLGLRQRGASRRFMLLAGVSILFGYYVLLFVSRAYMLSSSMLTPAAAAWMPNVVVTLIAAMMTIRSRRQVVA
jgi:hypothetical protein